MQSRRGDGSGGQELYVTLLWQQFFAGRYGIKSVYADPLCFAPLKRLLMCLFVQHLCPPAIHARANMTEKNDYAKNYLHDS